MMPKLAANITLLFRELPLIERIGAAAAAGFKAVECLWPYEIPAEHFRAELDKHGVELVLINTPLAVAPDVHFGLLACSGREDDFASAMRKALAYATTSGATRMHVMAGDWPQTPGNRAAVVANLRAIAPHAQAAGIVLCIEPINARDRPNWFLRPTQTALDIVDEIASPAVKLLFDIYHVQILEGDLIRRLESCIDRIGHVQIAGVPERHEPDDGEVNIHAVLATLERLGYAGFVGCEYNPRRGTQEGLGWAHRYGIGASLGGTT